MKEMMIISSLLQRFSKVKEWGFPGGVVVESPPADAGDMGSCPGPGGSHMPRSGWAREPWPLGLHVWSLCSATGEAKTVRGPRTANKTKQTTTKKPNQGFPGGAVVGGPPADAGDTGSCPGPGGSHMPWSGWAREPWPLSLHVWSLCSATGEATAVRGPRTAI